MKKEEILKTLIIYNKEYHVFKPFVDIIELTEMSDRLYKLFVMSDDVTPICPECKSDKTKQHRKSWYSCKCGNRWEK